jgi:hypothetical protein
MLSAEGCRQRRQRLWQRLPERPDGDILILGDPIHLMYLANFFVDPFSLGGGFGGYLVLTPDGQARLIHDDRLPQDVENAHVDDRIVVPWYDGQADGRGARQSALRDAVGEGRPFRVHDEPNDPLGPTVIGTLASLRRQKDPDELALLTQSMRAGEAGHAWALREVRPGMTELEVYRGVASACTEAAGRAVIVYGDFAVSPGPERRGGPPTRRVLAAGDMMILDFSVVIGIYRGDFTNTMVVGGKPRDDQRRLYDSCIAAMRAGEDQLRGGAACQQVYDAVFQSFEKAGMAEHFPHHAGHGLGLTHPEAPYFVRRSGETLLENDVVTLEPGLYVSNVGGIRIENNYRITANGFETMSHHQIALA